LGGDATAATQAARVIVLVAVVAAIAAWTAVLRRDRRPGPAGTWSVTAALVLAAAVAEAVAQVRGQLIDHRLGVVLHVVAMLGFGAAIVLARRSRGAVGRRELVRLEGALLVVTALLVTVNVAAPAAPAQLSGLSMLGWLRLVVDMTVVAVALLALTKISAPSPIGLMTLLPLNAATVALALADAASIRSAGRASVHVDSPVLRFAVAMAFVVLGYAATRSTTPTAISDRREESLALLAAFAPGFLCVVSTEGYYAAGVRVPVEMAAASVGLAALLFLRLMTALVDNRVLARTLEKQVADRTLDLVTREQWFRALVQNASDVLTVVDTRATVRYQSPAFERWFGHDSDAMAGVSLTPLLRPEDAVRLLEALVAVSRVPGTSAVLELEIWHRAGRWCHTETVVTNLLDEPTIHGLVLNIRDISDRRRLQERLTHEAYHDALTGLANRALLQRHLDEAVREAGRDQVAVLFCDLDGFKAVNDSRGHEMGDRLLCLVAGRLARCVRDGDVVARFGGDEFAVLVRGNGASALASDIAHRVVVSISEPFSVDGVELRVGASIGIAAVGEGARSADELMRNADLAMYRAKGSRDQSVVVFKPAMHDALLARLEVENDLREAIGRGQLVLHYQTSVDLATCRSVGVEALMRWYHPDRGVVAPESFIAVAEEKGYIEAMGEWALYEAARQGARWQAYAPPGQVLQMAVNISPWQVTARLVDVVRDVLTNSALPPEALVLEVTESVLLERTVEAVRVLGDLKSLGVRIAVDDFGTGYSSLSYLSKFPVDILKIDRQFVERLPSSDDAVALTRTIVNLGQALGLTTIAEGVESWPQVNILRDMGCDHAQGYLFCRPLPATGVAQVFALDYDQARRTPQDVATLVPFPRRAQVTA
jgi:diguanylate cyclase (GGDEF)-like protein/PAS domain S-box-containing protein